MFHLTIMITTNPIFHIGSDSIAVDLSDIYEQFDAEHCPALHEKPKLFPIQACRGGN